MVAGPGRTHGQPLSQSRVSALLNGAEQFSAFMHDYRDTAATTLAEPGWLRLGPQHAVFFRRGEKPRRSRHHGHEHDVIDADAFTQIMAGTGLLGARRTEGGLGDWGNPSPSADWPRSPVSRSTSSTAPPRSANGSNSCAPRSTTHHLIRPSASLPTTQAA
jgi:hypothetical protein